MTSSSFPIKLCEKRPSIARHFEKQQVRNILLVKEPCNHVNLKSIFNSRGTSDIVLLKHLLQECTRKLYLLLLCRHGPQLVLVCQLHISQTLHHDRHIFLKFLQCHPWVLYRGVFHYKHHEMFKNE